MKLSKIITLGFLSMLVACAPMNHPSTDGIDQTIATAGAGLFGKCVEHSEYAGDMLQDAKFHRNKIANAATPQPNWYYERTQKIAEKAVAQRELAEQVCREYLGMSMTRDIAGLDKQQIFFNLGSSQVRASEQAKLDKIIATYKENPGSEVVLMGFTDTTGSKDFNQKLSTQRAATVFSELRGRAKGVDMTVVPEQIEVIGRGEVPGPDNVKLQANRRVDVVVVPSARARMKK